MAAQRNSPKALPDNFETSTSRRLPQNTQQETSKLHIQSSYKCVPDVTNIYFKKLVNLMSNSPHNSQIKLRSVSVYYTEIHECCVCHIATAH